MKMADVKKAEEMVEALKNALSNYFLGYCAPESLDGLVDTGWHNEGLIIWLSSDLFTNFGEEYSLENVQEIISRITGWRFPDEWGFNIDSQGAYWYHLTEEKGDCWFN